MGDVSGRQYDERKRYTKSEEKEQPVQKSKQLKGKSTTTQPEESIPEKEPFKDMESEKGLSEISSGEDLPDVPWTKPK